MYQVYHRTVQIHHGTSFEKFRFHYWYKIFVFAFVSYGNSHSLKTLNAIWDQSPIQNSLR